MRRVVTRTHKRARFNDANTYARAHFHDTHTHPRALKACVAHAHTLVSRTLSCSDSLSTRQRQWVVASDSTHVAFLSWSRWPPRACSGGSTPCTPFWHQRPPGPRSERAECFEPTTSALAAAPAVAVVLADAVAASKKKCAGIHTWGKCSTHCSYVRGIFMYIRFVQQQPHRPALKARLLTHLFGMLS